VAIGAIGEGGLRVLNEGLIRGLMIAARDIDRIAAVEEKAGAAAALVAAAESSDVAAVVSRGGRPDLAGDALPEVTCPTLLIVGGDDDVVIELNEGARARMVCPTESVIIPGATHLFEETGTLEQVAELASAWFVRYLAATT
jgi:putative phosphoribosyl transferase